MRDKATHPAGGRVAIVGAGPGDPDLLTMKAFRRIGEAEVILHDNLVSDEILALAPRARRIDVGKVGGGRRTSQEVINRLLVNEARAGHFVVRLKGGDPFVFGRGSEEAVFLAEHGIDAEIVPGISASVAAASSAMIPVTHRGVSAHFSVVTATSAKEDNATLETAWRDLAAAGGTVVFLMGLRKLDRIVSNVRAAGVPDGRPMAIISAATTGDEAIVTGTVGNIVQRAAAAALPTPATIVLGDVVGIRNQIIALTARPSLTARLG